jgi:hypothetical protein
MIKIRSNVFETNSSSTHSITIDFNYKEKVFKHDKLPNNETIVIANDDVNFQFHSNGNNTTEWTKLNAIVNYILGHYWALGYFYFCKILQTENNYFTILEKIIKDKCNSVVNYNLYDLLDIESITDSNYGHSLVIFGLCEKSTEKEIYNCLKQLIFDENVAIKYED